MLRIKQRWCILRIDFGAESCHSKNIKQPQLRKKARCEFTPLRKAEIFMRIAIINEVSTQQKNGDILKALGDRGYKVLNLGMTGDPTLPELTYIHTGLMTAIMLNTGAADFVVGGCGTGQGYMNAVLQYPGVSCGLVSSALDAWLFTQINGGNCISLPLNQGYGWAADVNLQFIFDRIFSVKSGCGYPENRRESQQKSRAVLAEISRSEERRVGKECGS